MDEKTKICSHCKKELPVRFFYKNKSLADGLTRYCIVCQDESIKRSNKKKKKTVKTYKDGPPKWMFD